MPNRLEEELRAVQNAKQYYKKIYLDITDEYNEIMLILGKEEEKLLKQLEEE